MRSSTTVYTKDGRAIEVVTIENKKMDMTPASIAGDNKVEDAKLVESKPVVFGPAIAKSEPDR